MANSISLNLTPTSVPVSLTGIPHTGRTTVLDVIEHLRDLLGADATVESDRIIRRSILEALREYANAFNWSYLYAHARLDTNGHYVAGTVQLQVSGGTYPYQVTLTGGAWPSWAAYGTLRIGTITYDVDTVYSSTVLTVLPAQGPLAGDDVAAGSGFDLYRDTYTLPQDFAAADVAAADTTLGEMAYVHPNLWLQSFRFQQSYSNTPRWYTFRGDPKIPGRLAMSIFPYPDSDRTIDFIYKRRPRAVATGEYMTGTVTVDAAGAPTVATGAGTAWTSAMIGAVIRFSADGVNLPTSFVGSNPYLFERTIKTVSSGGSLSFDDVAPQSVAGVCYRISDPIDIEEGAMLDGFLRCCEKHVAILRRFKDKSDFELAYRTALIRAREADSRNFAQRVAGEGGLYRQRMARMPTGPDIS